MLDKGISNQIIDFVSASCSEGTITFNAYTDDIRSGDISAMEYLKKEKRLAFLAENNYILFYTTKHSKGVGKSFEYKLRNFRNDKDFFRLINIWDDKQSAAWITRLSLCDVKGDAQNGGVYFIGVEYPIGRVVKLDNAVLKVYFSAPYNAPDGSREYFNDRYIEKITACGIEFFNDIKDKIKKFIDIGFDIYMVGWNHDKVSKINKYKIYFILSRKMDEDKFYREIEEYSRCDRLREFTRKKDLYMGGFALCKDDKSVQSVNIYYRGAHEEI